MPIVDRVVVTLDCAEPRALAQFWSALLGGELTFTPSGNGIVRTERLELAAMRVEGYVRPTWPAPDVPKQMHVDLFVADLDAAVAEATRLGAASASSQPAPDLRQILFDPAGHPFCLIQS